MASESFSPRVSWVGLLFLCQTLFIVAASLLSTVALKVSGLDRYGHPPSLPVWLREWGFLLLCVPLAWALAAGAARWERFAATRASVVLLFAGVVLSAGFFALAIMGFLRGLLG